MTAKSGATQSYRLLVIFGRTFHLVGDKFFDVKLDIRVSNFKPLKRKLIEVQFTAPEVKLQYDVEIVNGKSSQ